MPWSCSPAISWVIPQVYLSYAKVDTPHLDAWDDHPPPPGKINYVTQAASKGKGSYSNCRTNIHLLPLVTSRTQNWQMILISNPEMIMWADFPISKPLPSPKLHMFATENRPSPKMKVSGIPSTIFQGRTVRFGVCVCIFIV